MPNVDDMFPSKYLKADDLKGRRVLVTIETVSTETMGQGKDARDKLVLYFKGKDKGMAVNKTNALLLSDIFSSKNTEDWHGQQVYLAPTRVMFDGKPVMSIRVEEAPRQRPAAAAQPNRQAPARGFEEQQQPPDEPDAAGQFVDEEVPF